MAIQSKELRYSFCHEHVERTDDKYWTRQHPGYLFNTYHLFPARKCSITGCTEPAYFGSIGVQVPEGIPEKILIDKRAQKEIFFSAKQILAGGSAIERLPVFLKTKIIPTYKTFITDQIIKHHAKCILKMLAIDENKTLVENDMVRILKELDLFPADDK